MRAEVFAPAGWPTRGSSARSNSTASASRRGSRSWTASRLPSGDASTFPWDWSMRGAGGVVSTARDLERWTVRCATGASCRRRAAAHVQAGARGLRLRLDVGELDAKGGPAWVFHTGRTLGYQAYVARWLAEDRVVVVLTDEATDPRCCTGRW